MGKQRGYQYGYGDKFSDYMYDVSSRTRKAERAIVMFKDFFTNLHKFSCLDIGCTAGIMTYHLAKYFYKAVGIDIDGKSLSHANDCFNKENILFLEADALNMPFADESFEAAVCHHTYEHVSSAEILVEEIYRVLKPGGVCYFGAPNRFMIIESHYSLPFLSWFPRRLSNLYLKIAKKGDDYYERIYSYWGLRKLLRRFEIHDYTLKVIKQPVKYSSTDVVKEGAFVQQLPTWLLKFMIYFIPNYVLMLKKK